MNEHIELVRKWLADPDSVTRQELQKNSRYAKAAYDAAEAARWAADDDAFWADASAAAEAAYWVKRFEEISDE